MHYVSEKGGGLTRRQFVGGAAALVATAALVACGGAGDGADSSASEPGTAAAGAKRRTLTVFAAASLTEALQQIGRMFERKHTGVTVEFNFDSSGTLCTQIAEGGKGGRVLLRCGKADGPAGRWARRPGGCRRGRSRHPH